MVTDITRRVNRLQLAKEIIKRSLALAGKTPAFTNAEITKAAWAYLAVTRLNTARLEAKLKRLNSLGA